MERQILVAVTVGYRYVRLSQKLDTLIGNMRPQHAELSADRAITINELFRNRRGPKPGRAAMTRALKHYTAE